MHPLSISVCFLGFLLLLFKTSSSRTEDNSSNNADKVNTDLDVHIWNDAPFCRDNDDHNDYCDGNHSTDGDNDDDDDDDDDDDHDQSTIPPSLFLREPVFDNFNVAKNKNKNKNTAGYVFAVLSKEIG